MDGPASPNSPLVQPDHAPKTIPLSPPKRLEVGFTGIKPLPQTSLQNQTLLNQPITAQATSSHMMQSQPIRGQGSSYIMPNQPITHSSHISQPQPITGQMANVMRNQPMRRQVPGDQNQPMRRQVPGDQNQPMRRQAAGDQNQPMRRQAAGDISHPHRTPVLPLSQPHAKAAEERKKLQEAFANPFGCGFDTDFFIKEEERKKEEKSIRQAEMEKKKEMERLKMAENPEDYMQPLLGKNVSYDLWELGELRVLIRCGKHGKVKQSTKKPGVSRYIAIFSI